MKKKGSFKGILAAGLASLVLGCSTLPNYSSAPSVPLDEFYKMGVGSDDSLLEIDTERNGKTDIVSNYRVLGLGVANGGSEVFTFLEYGGYKAKNRFIFPDFSRSPRVSLDEVGAIMADSEGIHLLIDTKKDGHIDMTADYNASLNKDKARFNLTFRSYESIKDSKSPLNQNYHARPQIDSDSTSI